MKIQKCQTPAKMSFNILNTENVISTVSCNREHCNRNWQMLLFAYLRQKNFIYITSKQSKQFLFDVNKYVFTLAMWLHAFSRIMLLSSHAQQKSQRNAMSLVSPWNHEVASTRRHHSVRRNRWHRYSRKHCLELLEISWKDLASSL